MTDVNVTIGVQTQPAEAGDGAWPDGFGAATYGNARAAVTRLGYRFSLDTFASRKKYVTPDGKHRKVSRKTIPLLRQQIRETFGFDVRKEPLADAIDALCFENCRHPVKKYLKRLDWDGVERLGSWLIDYFGAEDTPLNRAMSALTLVAAVRRTFKPGTPYDLVLTLCGKSGIEKSKGVRALAVRPHWHSDADLLGVSHDRQIEQLDGVFIYELSDMAGYTAANVQRTKALISRVEDRLRRPYERERDDRRRSVIFIATVDRDEFLLDRAGNRRFVPVKVTQVRLTRLIRDIDQLWAEAVAREPDFGPLELPRELWGASEALQRKHMVFEPWIDELRGVQGVAFKGGLFISNARIHETLRLTARELTPIAHGRILDAMTALGYERRGPVKLDGKAQRGFFRLSVEE
ncbi:MAG: hypothetical protein JNM47_04360 [Hyphomonadaceae bacterium]|nr:hypothetical protein [Hyphomonadaceae bacterium]